MSVTEYVLQNGAILVFNPTMTTEGKPAVEFESLELRELLQRLQTVNDPEEVFGELEGSTVEQTEEGHQIYRRIARRVHPDAVARHGTHNPDDSIIATAQLNLMWERAKEKIQNKTYGQRDASGIVTITTRRRSYTVTGQLATGDLCNLYHCSFSVDGQKMTGIMKVARDPIDNDLVSNEARVLKRLEKADTEGRFTPFLPKLQENLVYRDSTSPTPRQANVLTYVKDVKSPADLYSLADIRKHYPDGVDAKDMAWMWRRVLTLLGFVHEQQVVHGAVLPSHILVHPELHGVLLIDWAYASTEGAKITAISTACESYYPQEVFKKETPTAALDIYMAARSMLYLMGSDDGKQTGNIPHRIYKFFEWCTLDGQRMRPQAAWPLLEEFDELIENLWGPRQFHEFTIPKS
ncbi:MAG: molecular chaperone DnaJ [Chloroflexota bacterium]